jgi:hypothetical protein
VLPARVMAAADTVFTGALSAALAGQHMTG